eukprot:2834036-Prymnesium_polylepis.1
MLRGHDTGSRRRSSLVPKSLCVATPLAMSASSSTFRFVSPTTLPRPRSYLPVVTPGEAIPAEPGFLRGHGTMVRQDGTLIATVAGT